MPALRIIPLVFCLLFALGCKNPTEDLKIIIDTDIVKYTAMINVTDAATGGPAPQNATISVSGGAARDVYDVSGDKNIRLREGMVTIGLGPDTVPVAGKPIRIAVAIAASGYNSVSREITFTEGQMQQLVTIPLVKTGSTTPPVQPPPLAVYNNVTLNFTGVCSSRSDLQIRPSLYVFVRKSGTTDPYQYLGYMEKGTITTNHLAQGETYDFQVAFGGETYHVSQKIESVKYDLTLDMGNACNKY